MSVACALCGAPAAPVLYRLPNGAILRCGACRVVFRENQVDNAAAAALYDDDGYLDTPYFEALKVGRRRDVEPYLVYGRALARLETLTVGRRLLDVGAAYGAFMELAKERGWEVSGVDISAKASSYAARERGLSVFHGTLDQALQGYLGILCGFGTRWIVVREVATDSARLHRLTSLLVIAGSAARVVGGLLGVAPWLSPVTG